MGIVHPGPANPNWRGGRSIASNGYVLLRVGTDHHLADVRGYAYEHRVVAEVKIGRRLRDDEEVHHKNENKQDNAPDNLEVVTRPAHRLEHRRVRHDLRLPGESVSWVIVGGESGPGAREFDLQWGRDVVSQCRGAGVPCFVKQLGADPIDGLAGCSVPFRSRKADDPSEWPPELQVQQFPGEARL